LKPDTLRAWERRYGLPNPQRTPGGHRLYSQRDIDMLKWLIARQEEGMSISRAGELWRQLEEQGRDPLEDMQFNMSETPPVVANVSPGDNLRALRSSWIDACMDFDERRADSVLAEAFALFPTETVCFELLQQALSEIGIGWYEGRITVQQEHFASALAIRRLETMVAATPAPTRNGRILAACPSEERHTFSLLLITLLLRRNGWDVIYLGANVPAARLEPTLATASPHIVILAAQTLFTASTMLPMAMLLQRERVLTAYGGAVFNHIPLLRERMPGYFLGEKIKNVPHIIEQLLTNPPPMPMYDRPSEEYQTALRHYIDKQPEIEAEIWRMFDKSDMQSYLKNANKDLGQNLIAALTFGEMDLLETNIEWVRGLLVNYHYRMPDAVMREYFQSYFKACQKTMDSRGLVIKEWFDITLKS
ncbi:MAG: MerR family transcriptional regulator, partial [Chloroflexota bacterium]